MDNNNFTLGYAEYNQVHMILFQLHLMVIKK